MKYRFIRLFGCLLLVLVLWGCSRSGLTKEETSMEAELSDAENTGTETDSFETIEEPQIIEESEKINQDPFQKPEGVRFSCFNYGRVYFPMEEETWWTLEQYFADSDPAAPEYFETKFRGQSIMGDYGHSTEHYPGTSAILDYYRNSQEDYGFLVERGTDGHVAGYREDYPGPCSEELSEEEAQALAVEFVSDIFDPEEYEIRTEPNIGPLDTGLQEDLGKEYLLCYEVFFEKPIEDLSIDRYIKVSVAGDGMVYGYDEKNELAFQTYLEKYGEETLLQEADILMRKEVLDYAKEVFKEAGIKTGIIRTSLTIGGEGELVLMIWKEQRDDSAYKEFDFIMFVRIQN